MPDAGWFQDPENPANDRYWDGAAWTSHVRPRTPLQAPPPYAPPPQAAQPYAPQAAQPYAPQAAQLYAPQPTHTSIGTASQSYAPQYQAPVAPSRPVWTRTGFKILGVVLVLFLGWLTVSSVLEDPSTDLTNRDASGSISDSGFVGVFKLRVGDCVDLPDELTTAVTAPDELTELAGVQGVPCSSLHDGEVFGLYDTALGSFDMAALDAEAQTRCADAALNYVADVSPTSDASLGIMPPSAETWAAGDRATVCYFSFPVQRDYSVRNGVL